MEGGAEAAPRASARAGGRAPASERVVNTITDARFERYLWQLQKYRDSLLVSGRRDLQRHVNQVANLREMIVLGLADAHTRGDRDAAGRWTAEQRLGEQANPFELV